MKELIGLGYDGWVYKRILGQVLEMAAVVQMAKSGEQEADMKGGQAKRTVWLWAKTEDGKGSQLAGGSFVWGPWAFLEDRCPETMEPLRQC